MNSDIKGDMNGEGSSGSRRAAGSVTLVGAGPGDPELLTVKAVKAIRRATVLLVDDLVDAAVLRHARRSARIIHVGKRGSGYCTPRALPASAEGPAGLRTVEQRSGGKPSTPQPFIHKLMVAQARRGEHVVRLKGGDPFVFGRGGEERDALRAAGIEPVVIAGLTAGIAGPAAAGIAVTDRRHAPGVALVTGHASANGVQPDWPALVRSGLTLVVYMGLARCADIQRALLEAGMAPRTPAAVVASACTPRQQHLACELATLEASVRDAGLQSPAVLVFGDVARAAALSALQAPVEMHRRSR